MRDSQRPLEGFPSRLVPASDWGAEWFTRLLLELRQPFLFHRKVWEWVVTAEALRRLGSLGPSKVGLGLGTGTEPLCYYFANRCGRISATDLFAESSRWREAQTSLEAAYDKAEFHYRRDRLEFRNMDMRRLEFPDRSMDFVWSCSSVEHLPSRDDVLQVFAEIARVLRPNRHAVITTEFNLEPGHRYIPDLILFDEDLLRVIERETELRLVGPLDLGLSDHPYYTPFDVDYLQLLPDSSHLPHLVVRRGDLLFASVLLVFEKNPSLPPFEIIRRLDPVLIKELAARADMFRRRLVHRFRPQPRFTLCGFYEASGPEGPLLRADHKLGILSYGPYVWLPSGPYCVRFDLGISAIADDALPSSPICTLDVQVSNGRAVRTLVKFEVIRALVPPGGDLHPLLYFCSSGLEQYEFRVATSGNATVDFFGSVVEPL